MIIGYESLPRITPIPCSKLIVEWLYAPAPLEIPVLVGPLAAFPTPYLLLSYLKERDKEPPHPSQSFQ